MLTFEVLIDESFVNIADGISIGTVGNKSVLSLVNDFEDGNWRFERFQQFVWDNIAETALSERERSSLIEKPFSVLTAAAKNLRFTDNETEEKGLGSEIAEIVLYGIMKHHFNALPVVPKIFYKQNTHDYAKGSDSVHIVVNEDDFSLWFGEAKFYNSIEDVRLNKIVESVENSLQTEKLKKENSIITNVSDLDLLQIDGELKKKVRDLLYSDTSIDLIKKKINIPILLLHQCEITKNETQLTKEYTDKIIEYHKDRAISYFKKQINKIEGSIHLYSEIKFHLILFPVPVKDDIVKKFVTNIETFQK